MKLTSRIINDASNKLTRRVKCERLCMIFSSFAKRLTVVLNTATPGYVVRGSSREIYIAFLRAFDHLDLGARRRRNNDWRRLWFFVVRADAARRRNGLRPFALE